MLILSLGPCSGWIWAVFSTFWRYILPPSSGPEDNGTMYIWHIGSTAYIHRV
jgi:hypothetical protein